MVPPCNMAMGERKNSKDSLSLGLELGSFEDAVVSIIPERASSREVTRPGTKDAAVRWQRIGLKLSVSISLFLLLTFLLEKFAGNVVTNISATVMDCIGTPGIFLVVFLLDGLPQPFPYVPLIFMAVKGSIPKHAVFFICSAASYSSALVGYAVGMNIRRLKWGNALFSRLSDEHPYVLELMERKGALGVAIAALLPVPLAIATWTAGSFRIYFPHFMIAALCRMPKIMVFVLLSRGPQSSTQVVQTS